jgi:ribosomal protein L16 Arg81 hydroxylase
MIEKGPSELTSVDWGQPTIFDRVISPVGREVFFSEVWGKKLLALSGPADRFKSLLSWDELNSILEQHRLEPPRLRLVRDAKPVDSKLFMGRSRFRSRLNSAGLMNSLAEGATMILDNVDELAPSVGQLAEAFQEALRSQTTVNLYAGWRTQKGFDLHWDPQDTMILQVSGRKHWKVYSPTRLHPFKKDRKSIPMPTGEPAWDGVLENGDMIYLPRGWWHVAFPLDEPSLHLTVTIVPANGADLLRWCVDQLERYTEVRMNVPHLSNDIDQKQYLARLRKLLMESVSDDVLEEFMRERESMIPVQPHIRLPSSPVESKAPITLKSRVRLTSTRRMAFMSPSINGTVSFAAGEIRGECSTNLVPALAELRGTASCFVEELCAHLPDQSDTSELMILLTALAMRGALQIQPREA